MDEHALSEREQEVFRLLATAASSAEIAAALSIRASTVRSHIMHIQQKLGTRSMPEVTRLAVYHHEIWKCCPGEGSTK
ncbi:MAG: LuxR C-terminal-related transcriptional regulator [Dehalococcoidia bacterium]